MVGFINRMVGMNRRPSYKRDGGRVPFRDPIIGVEGEDGARVVQYDDNSMGGIAARHNASQIYGAANVPHNFGRRTVIEVPDGNGGYTPVNQSNPGAPIGEQIIALDHYRETGNIFGSGQGVDGLIQGAGNPGAGNSSSRQLPGAANLSPATNRPGLQAGANPNGNGLNVSLRPVMATRPAEFITTGDGGKAGAAGTSDPLVTPRLPQTGNFR